MSYKNSQIKTMSSFYKNKAKELLLNESTTKDDIHKLVSDLHGRILRAFIICELSILKEFHKEYKLICNIIKINELSIHNKTQSSLEMIPKTYYAFGKLLKSYTINFQRKVGISLAVLSIHNIDDAINIIDRFDKSMYSDYYKKNKNILIYSQYCSICYFDLKMKINKREFINDEYKQKMKELDWYFINTKELNLKPLYSNKDNNACV